MVDDILSGGRKTVVRSSFTEIIKGHKIEC